MQVSYNITDEFKEKYISSNFDTKNKTILRNVVLVASIILSVISLISLIAKDYFLFIFPLFIAISGFYIVFLPRILKKRYIKSLDFKNENVVEINKDSLIIVSSSRTTKFEYSQIKEVNLINNYFILIKFKPGDSVLVPTYALSDDSEVINFINKIKTNANIL